LNQLLYSWRIETVINTAKSSESALKSNKASQVYSKSIVIPSSTPIEGTISCFSVVDHGSSTTWTGVSGANVEVDISLVGIIYKIDRKDPIIAT
jgi:hypothetical protein